MMKKLPYTIYLHRLATLIRKLLVHFYTDNELLKMDLYPVISSPGTSEEKVLRFTRKMSYQDNLKECLELSLGLLLEGKITKEIKIFDIDECYSRFRGYGDDYEFRTNLLDTDTDLIILTGYSIVNGVDPKTLKAFWSTMYSFVTTIYKGRLFVVGNGDVTMFEGKSILNQFSKMYLPVTQQQQSRYKIDISKILNGYSQY